MEEYVILVDESDKVTGQMEKLEVHRKGLLHRAVSVFVFNDRNELLLQQRAKTKYHSPGLWTNTCCSHPRPEEETLLAAERRLWEECGLKTKLSHKTSFIYRCDFANGLTEHEYDHIYIGYSNEIPIVNLSEAADYKWQSIDEIKKGIKTSPERFTVWFKIAMDKFF